MSDDKRVPASSMAVATRGITAEPTYDVSDRIRASVELSRSALEQSGLCMPTCPMCGVNPASSIKNRKLEHVPPWVYAGLFFNVFILLLLYFVARKVVRADVALCDDCAAAEKRARNLRGASIGGLILAPVVGTVLGAALGGMEATIIGLGAGTVAGVVGMIASHVHTRWDVISCKKIDKDKVVLEGTGHFPATIEKEAPDLLLEPGAS